MGSGRLQPAPHPPPLHTQAHGCTRPLGLAREPRLTYALAPGCAPTASVAPPPPPPGPRGPRPAAPAPAAARTPRQGPADAAGSARAAAESPPPPPPRPDGARPQTGCGRCGPAPGPAPGRRGGKRSGRRPSPAGPTDTRGDAPPPPAPPRGPKFVQLDAIFAAGTLSAPPARYLRRRGHRHGRGRGVPAGGAEWGAPAARAGRRGALGLHGRPGTEAAAARADAPDAAPGRAGLGRAGRATDPRPGSAAAARAAPPGGCRPAPPPPRGPRPRPPRAHWTAPRPLDRPPRPLDRPPPAPIGPPRGHTPPLAGCSRAGRSRAAPGAGGPGFCRPPARRPPPRRPRRRGGPASSRDAPARAAGPGRRPRLLGGLPGSRLFFNARLPTSRAPYVTPGAGWQSLPCRSGFRSHLGVATLWAGSPLGGAPRPEDCPPGLASLPTRSSEPDQPAAPGVTGRRYPAPPAGGGPFPRRGFHSFRTPPRQASQAFKKSRLRYSSVHAP